MPSIVIVQARESPCIAWECFGDLFTILILLISPYTVTSYYLLSGTWKKTSTTITKIGLCPIYMSSDDLLASIQF